ncbi:MAG: hypothetical protein B6U76_00950 [Desulfurococcales archaeon ex4484_217_2]|nr:MAG: hypothetical protein B6U76_00950 [Desulfurococcales archaeon ex4484_217_2]
MASIVKLMVVFHDTIWNTDELERIAKDVAKVVREALKTNGYFDFEVRLADFYATISYPLPAGEP